MKTNPEFLQFLEDYHNDPSKENQEKLELDNITQLEENDIDIAIHLAKKYKKHSIIETLMKYKFGELNCAPKYFSRRVESWISERKHYDTKVAIKCEVNNALPDNALSTTEELAGIFRSYLFQKKLHENQTRVIESVLALKEQGKSVEEVLEWYEENGRIHIGA